MNPARSLAQADRNDADSPSAREGILDVEDEGSPALPEVWMLDQKTDRERVRSAILWYLLVFTALNLSSWISFFLHGHDHRAFPLGDTVERFGDLLRFSGKYQIGKDPRIRDPEHLIGTRFPANYPPFAVVIYLFLLQVCAPYALFVMLLAVLGAVGVACTLLWRRVRRFEGYRWYMGAAIFATGFFGWATEQVVMRGNIECILWIGVCLGAALYTLMVLLVPMGFFLIFLLQDVAESRTRMSLGEMLWFVLPCAWIMATEPLWLLHGVLKCVALLLLLGASMRIPLPSTQFGEITC